MPLAPHAWRDDYVPSLFPPGRDRTSRVEVGQPYLRTYWERSDIDTDRFDSRSALVFKNKWFKAENRLIFGWDFTDQDKTEAFYDQVPVGAVGAGNLPEGAYITNGQLLNNAISGRNRAYEYIDPAQPADRSILRFNEIIESDIPRLPFEIQPGGLGAPGSAAEWALARTTNSSITNNSLWFAGQSEFLDGRVHTLVGLRYDHIKAESAFRRVFLHGFDRGADPLNNNRSQVSYDQLNPSLGGLFWINENLALFGNYARSIESPSGTERTPIGEIAPPELGEGYEAGFRFDILNGKLDGQFAFYRIIKENDNEFAYSDGLLRQIYTFEQYGTTHPGIFFPGGDRNLNTRAIAGRRSIGDKTRSDGIEMDLTYNPLPGLSFIASYNHALANEIEELHSSAGDPGEYELFGRPDHRATLTARYKFQDGPFKRLTVGATQRFRSASTQSRFDLNYDARWQPRRQDRPARRQRQRRSHPARLSEIRRRIYDRTLRHMVDEHRQRAWLLQN